MLDIDGVFTDNCVYCEMDGKTMKKFNYEDSSALYELKNMCSDLDIVLFSSDDFVGFAISNQRFSYLGFEPQRVEMEEREKFIRDKLSNYELDQCLIVSDNLSDARLIDALELKHFAYPKNSGAAVYWSKTEKGKSVTSILQRSLKEDLWRKAGEGFVADVLYYYFEDHLLTK